MLSKKNGDEKLLFLLVFDIKETEKFLVHKKKEEKY